MIDLASEAVGGAIVYCNDDFFAPASNLLSDKDPVWKQGEYTDRGKWMDGWESRRRREPGHDWCDIALGIPGLVEKVLVDTSHFTGNFPEAFSLEAIGTGSTEGEVDDEWVEIIPRTVLSGNTVAEFEVLDRHRITHVRFKIYPDGGVARLRILGTPIPPMGGVCPNGATVDLAALGIGGEVVDASDLYFSPPTNLLRPTESRGMWDGWETKRRRGPGHDWVILELGLPGNLESFVVDTRHFKGNAPGWVSIEVAEDGAGWAEVVARTAVTADAVATITPHASAHGRFVRLNIHPDGGLSRFRVLGRPDPGPASNLRVVYLNALFPGVAGSFFSAACASHEWVETMVASRPFANAEQVLDMAAAAFDRLSGPNWLEAFAGHPRIGERGGALAESEQSVVRAAGEKTLEELAAVNLAYQERFGHIFIVEASGRTADEILAIARGRIDNDPATELEIAAGEQRAITETRLRRMLCLAAPR